MAEFIPNYTQGVEGANTAILPENTQALKTYLGLAEQNYKNDLLAHKKAVQESKDIAANTNYNIKDMWEDDIPTTKDKMFELKKMGRETPEKILNADDEYIAIDKDINYAINKSKHDKILYDYWSKQALENPLYRDNPEPLLNSLKAFKENRDIKNREFVPPIPEPTFNLFDHNEEIVKGTVSSNPDKITSKNDGHGNRIYEIPQDVDKSEIKQKVEMKWFADKNKATRFFNNLPDEEKAKYNNSPHDWYVQAKTESLPIDDDSKIAIRSIPQGRSSSSATAKKVVPYEIGISATENTGAAGTTDNMEKAAHIGGWAVNTTPITVSSPEVLYNMKDGIQEVPTQGYITGKVIKITDDYTYKEGNKSGKPAGMIVASNSDKLDKLLKNGDLEKKRFVTMVVSGAKGKTTEYRFEYNDEVGQLLAKQGVKLQDPEEAKKSGSQKYTLAEIKAAHAKELAGYSDAEIMEAYKDYLK